LNSNFQYGITKTGFPVMQSLQASTTLAKHDNLQNLKSNEFGAALFLRQQIENHGNYLIFDEPWEYGHWLHGRSSALAKSTSHQIQELVSKCVCVFFGLDAWLAS
jgi:hypothetical protein